jgi:hypothetical protein
VVQPGTDVAGAKKDLIALRLCRHSGSSRGRAMKPTNEKKLKLHTETLRNLKSDELQNVVGGARWPTQSEQAGGCTIMSYTCNTISWDCW